MSIRKDGKIIAGQISLNIKTDNELSPTSENPIQNRVVTNALDTKQNIDQTVVIESTGALTVTPGNVYKWSIPGETAGTLTFDTSELSGKYTSIPVYIELGEESSVTGHDEIDKTGWYDLTWDGSSLSIQKSNSGNASDVIDETRDQSVQETLDDLVDGKADKVTDAVEGDLAGLDAEGNLTDAGIPIDKVARNDSFYSEMGVGRAENLIDSRAPSTERKFGFDTACGDISISDDGTADPTLLKGTTYVKNQLIGDSKVVKDLGQGVVTSNVAVSGDIDHAYIKGRSLVRNQLVPASVEKEGSSSNGVIEVSDAVAGYANALTMYGDAWVRNQQVQNGDFSDGTNNWSVLTSQATMSVQDNVLTLNIKDDASNPKNAWITTPIVLPKTHTVLIYSEIYSTVNCSPRINVTDSPQTHFVISTTEQAITANTWSVFSLKRTNNSNYTGGYLFFSAPSDATQGMQLKYRNVQLVDLTQLCNGDTTKIAAIQTWDDLVARYPEYANYVAYNTGEVVGVQPSVKVTGKNLFSGTVYLGGIANGISFINTSSVISSPYTTLGSYYGVGIKFPVKSGSTVIVSGTVAGNAYTGYSCYAKESDCTDRDKAISYRNSSSVNQIVIHVPAGASWVVVTWTAINSGTVLTFSNIQAELGSTATTYEPYHDGGTMTASAPLFGIGSARDSEEGIGGSRTSVIGSVDLGTLEWKSYDADTTGHSFYCLAPAEVKPVANNSVIPNLLCGKYDTSKPFMSSNVFIAYDKTLCQVATPTRWFVRDTSYSDATAFKTAMSGVMLYYELATPVESSVTPSAIALQNGYNVVMQTDGGRTANLTLDYDGTSFDVSLKTGRSYLVKKGSTSTLVTDGTTQSVTGGQDMIVDLNTLYNNVASLISPIVDWNTLVSDTGMYGSYMTYDTGTVVHSNQTEVKATGKNLFNVSRTSDSFSSTTGRRTFDFSKYYVGLTWSNNSYPTRVASHSVTGSTISVTTASNGNNYGVAFPVNVFPNSQYTLSIGSLDGASIRVAFYDNYGEWISAGDTVGTTNVLTFTTPATCYVVIIIVYATSASTTVTTTNIQLELGSTTTTYTPYYNGGTATAGVLKGIPGSVYDQLDAVTGNVTTRIGSYTFTGNENWVDAGITNTFRLNNVITNSYRTASNATSIPYMMAGYKPVLVMSASADDLSFEFNTTQHSPANSLFVKDSSCADTTEIAAKMAGKTVYYRLATYTKSTTTPQPLTQSTGNLTVLQTAGTLPVGLDVRHAVSEWDEPIVRNCKYIFRDNGEDSLVTGSTTVTYKHVVGGEHKLINLTQWFGRNREPSIDNFYKLFPTWKGADIPYDRGTILNYKGTGVRTIGFNAYNHATGTAVLLGGNQYQICGTYTSCSYTDQWGNTEELSIDDKGIFTPVNNGTLTVVGGNDTDTCVHLCWSGYKNYGEPDYEWFPYEEKGVPWDLSQWFPNGMNGIADVQDEMTNNSMTRKWGVKVFDGTEEWVSYSSNNGFMFNLTDMMTGQLLEGACSFIVVRNGSLGQIPDPYVMLGANNKFVYICNVLDEGVIETVDDWKAYLASLYAAGTPLVLIYPLATPVTSEVTPTQNFSYPVNDFGTEQSLPVNTLTLLTTDLDADIRYSLDFTRTVANYSKIEDDVKQLVEEKDNLARQDGNYADKGGTYTYATQLKDPNAQPVEASYGNRTAAGDVSIADNGTGDVTSLQGTTQIQNQLVHDTNMNTKSSVDGRLVLTDAVGGDVTKLLLKGGCVVHNQLVKESVEKTATGTGRLGVEDGVAGNAKALVMTAPRSVVVNQWVDYTQNITSINSSAASVTNDSNTRTSTMSILDTVLSTGIAFSSTINKVYVNHVYLFTALVTASQNTTTRFLYSTVANPANTVDVQANTETRVSFVSTITSSSLVSMLFYVNVGGTLDNGDSVVVKDAMVIDLTQYFNGNSALIDSIQSWDDLVAYDSTFASYVPYGTGTVKGVQPTVKVNHATDVACPVELFGVDNADDEFNGVSGVVTKKIGVVDLGTMTFSNYNEPQNNTPYGYCTFKVEGKAVGYMNVFCSKYLSSTVSAAENNHTYSAGQATNCVIVDSSFIGKTGAQIAEALSGVLYYYELATPTTSQYNPTAIPVVDIYNTALQTAGSRPCTLSLTYDGKDQTIALNPSHTYVFNDNQEDDSLVTGQSSIDVVGGEDQLVDLTQLYNGDSSKIANIHSWASLSTRFHRYRDFQPYNPGTVEPDCPVIRKFDNEHAYGIIYDPSQNTPACQWVELNNGVLTEVASFADFREIPCHQLQRCVMDDLANRHVAYYLDDNDSTKKYNGTRNGVTSDGSASVLTGADGDVMSELPIGYWDLDEDWQGTGKYLWLISDRPFMGSWYPAEIHDFFYVSPNGDTPRVQYVGAYRASICNADGTPINTTEGALSQSTGTSDTNKARSIAGALPYVSVSLADLTTRSGRNGGSTVNTKFHQWLALLMFIEQGTLDNQSISQGYSGGIQNAYCFWRKSGRVNVGNGTGQLVADSSSQDMDNFQKFTVGSTTVQRDTLKDSDGRYAWSIYNRNASSTRYYTSSPTPSNGDPVYTASTGTTTAGTVASYTLQSNRVIQFQYRGIENPFGEVWEFEHGIQKFQTGEMRSFRGSDNVTYTRSPVNDGVSSRAWTNPSSVVYWTTTGNLTTSTFLYSDSSLTTTTTVKYKDQPTYKYSSEGYWETLATSDYTMTAQRTAVSPVYTVRHNHWPLNGWDSRFDPITFFMRKTGSPGASGRYLPDYFYNDGMLGDRVVIRGGSSACGSSDGLGAVNVYTSLPASHVSISGRLSA